MERKKGRDEIGSGRIAFSGCAAEFWRHFSLSWRALKCEWAAGAAGAAKERMNQRGALLVRTKAEKKIP